MESCPVPQGCLKLNLIRHPSPNFGPRRNGAQAELVVIHYTAMESAKAALDRLCDPVSEVSAHYLIGQDGTCWQMVDEDMRAWHAGAGSWLGRDDVNSRSIGIELDNRGTHPFAEPQMARLEALLSGIMARWCIPPEGVIGHSDMAPGRKQDPGPRFDWQRLARQSLARRMKPGPESPPDWKRFRKHLSALGYPMDVADTDLLNAFRHRHRPWACGDLSPADMAASIDARQTSA